MSLNKYNLFRSKYPVFTYEKYTIRHTSTELKIVFHFFLTNNIQFYPEIRFLKRDFYQFDNIPSSLLNNLAFNLGMIELVSYWKATCSPTVHIKAGSLSEEQISFWKKLYYNGLGEFFYLNKINPDPDSFMEITTAGEEHFITSVNLAEKYIVPVGGGKDSIVSIELLSANSIPFIPFVVNQNEARQRTIENTKVADDMPSLSIMDSIEVNRMIDPQLLGLNKEGYLNGHTPFSAVLGFLSLISAIATNSKYIALSNESSANEASIPGTNINHQYSKSFEFEQDFRHYYKKFICPDIEYFSLLRPLNELQIAKLFAASKHHYNGFRSCNVGSKTDSWCGSCPKCLFTFIILSPFIDVKTLVGIFGKDLLNDSRLAEDFQKLTGNHTEKPFECVGTLNDVNTALFLLKKSLKKELPLLLQNYSTDLGEDQLSEMLYSTNRQHYVPVHLEQIIESAIK